MYFSSLIVLEACGCLSAVNSVVVRSMFDSPGFVSALAAIATCGTHSLMRWIGSMVPGVSILEHAVHCVASQMGWAMSSFVRILAISGWSSAVRLLACCRVLAADFIIRFIASVPCETRGLLCILM